MNQRHSSEGPNPGFGNHPSHGSNQEQQPGSQGWASHQGGQQSARDYSQGQQPGDTWGNQGQWGGQGGQMGGQSSQPAPYHDSGLGYNSGHSSAPFGGSSGLQGGQVGSQGGGGGYTGGTQDQGRYQGGHQGGYPGSQSFGQQPGSHLGGFQGSSSGVRTAASQGHWQNDPWQGGGSQQQGAWGQSGQSGLSGQWGPAGQGSQWAQPGQHQGGRGSDASSHQDLLDPDYQQWRNEQMRSFDDDYRNWRQERFRRFSDDFTNWRKGRSEQVAGAGEDRSAVLVAGPGSRSGSATQQDDHAERQNQSSPEGAGKQQGGSNPSKTK